MSLFNAVRNKELINATLSSDETLVLADVVSSLGHKLLRNEELSSVSCFTCARTLARIYGTFKKVNAGFVTVTAKRFSSNSPTGNSPSAKRTRELLAQSGTSRSPRRSLNLSSENQAPVARVSSLEDQMNSAMNLDSATGLNSVMKVRLACSIFKSYIYSRRSQSIEIDIGNQSIPSISIDINHRLISIEIGNR